MLISEACNNFLTRCEKNRNLSSLTLKAYTIDLDQFRDSVRADHEINDISKDHILSFQLRLVDKGLSPSSIKRKMACIRAMFRWLELDEYIPINPFRKVHLDIKVPKRLPRNVPTDQLRHLYHEARSAVGLLNSDLSIEGVAQKIKTGRDLNRLTALLAVEIMVSTGIRVSELSNIQIHHVFLANKKIKILGKGSRERFVYLSDPEICVLITTYLSARLVTQTAVTNLLVNSRGKPASTQFLRKLIKQLTPALSLQTHITPHMLRHSAACELLDAGLDIRFVQRLLGHSSIATTEIYTHVSDKSLQEKVVKANVRRRVMK